MDNSYNALFSLPPPPPYDNAAANTAPLLAAILLMPNSEVRTKNMESIQGRFDLMVGAGQNITMPHPLFTSSLRKDLTI
jgi:hypothetical protein